MTLAGASGGSNLYMARSGSRWGSTEFHRLLYKNIKPVSTVPIVKTHGHLCERKVATPNHFGSYRRAEPSVVPTSE